MSKPSQDSNIESESIKKNVSDDRIFNAYKNYCKTHLTHISMDTVNTLLDIDPIHFNKLFSIYKSSECLKRWNAVRVYISENITNTNYNTRFITSFYITSIQNYMDCIK